MIDDNNDDDVNDDVQGGLEIQVMISVFSMNFETSLSFPSEGEEGRCSIHGEKRYEILKCRKGSLVKELFLCWSHSSVF